MIDKNESRPASSSEVDGGNVEETEAAAWLPDLVGVPRGKSRALVEALRQAVQRGDLKDGAQLPSQRAIAAQTGVTISTVTKAIAEAARSGLVSTRPGGGTYVLGKKAPAAQDLAASGGAIDLSLNIPPVALVRDILDETFALLARRHGADQMLAYAPLCGERRDREAGAAWIAARGVVATTDHTMLTNGAYEGLFCALRALTRPGDVVLTEALNYTGVRRLAELCRIRLVGVAIDAHGLRADELAEACKRHSPKAILTTPVTLNPTGATQDLRRRQAVIAVAQQHSLAIVEDDIYGSLAGDETPPLAALWPQGVIYVTSLSKCVAPGLRAGYLHAPERFGYRLRSALQLLSWTAPSMHAAVASELIASGNARACAQAHADEARWRTALAHATIRSGWVSVPQAAYHGWLHLPEDWRVRDAAAVFHRHGVLVSPSHHFALEQSAEPGAVRVSLGAVTRAALQTALESMAAALEGPSPASASIV